MKILTRKKDFLFLYFVFCLNIFCFSQNKVLIQKYTNTIDKNTNESKIFFDKLIDLVSDSTTIDSQKVEIIYYFKENPCADCIEFMIDNIDMAFSYGLGFSGIDQFNTYACRGILTIIARDKNQKWGLIPPILNSLKHQIRSKSFIQDLTLLLAVISNKTTAKSIIEQELNAAKSTLINLRNSTYEENLMLMLKQF